MALVLCDIDGTMTSGSAYLSYSNSMTSAISEVFGRRLPVDLNRFHGYTDKLVLEALLGQHNVTFDSKLVKQCLDIFGEIFPDNPNDTTIIPGVLETIPKISQLHTLGLVTGNVEKMARKKLRMFSIDGRDLNTYFPFGGFGSDPHKERCDLIDLAISRARELDFTGDLSDVYVVDDAPRGIKAAIYAFVRPIGITTGLYTKRDLLRAGAKLVVSNFREIPELIK